MWRRKERMERGGAEDVHEGVGSVRKFD